MPDIDANPSWADQVEDGDDVLPPPTEDFHASTGTKILTEYKFNDDDKKVKVVRTFKIEKRKVSKSIATRKAWKKFGAAEKDAPGPNPSNTIISEDVIIQFVHSKDSQLNDNDEDPLNKIKGQKMVSCRICKGDHWTTKCPYKDSLAPLQESLDEKKKDGDAVDAAPGAPPGGAAAAKAPGGKYVPPNLRDGGNRRGESMMGGRKDESATIRVTNLSEDTREADLQELFKPFGNISRIYLAKDKVTGQSKGFAFINFHRREDAARAIQGISGFGYDHLILNVEWAKPSGTNP
ncbi:hypothetical protein CAPTEDRAFT_160910 [Capitella teleta]|uniref:Eukaryotic translation initiation factor 3 subunit G n=1 Tax=Capitella teleta TaxID=283909 RepID=R7TIL6_CAPTE|nr:hypothetical protein CAPTEDRAFT_160910 [Capitella teleta]|eukprot:ELT93683.1 hypothetical protein CAPTEDRAFT_160910 [Capitella teleta]